MHEQNKDNWKSRYRIFFVLHRFINDKKIYKDIYGIVQEKHKFKYLCQVHNFKKNIELLLQYIRQITVKLVN